MSDLSNVVNVQLLAQGASVARDNINVVAMVTGRQGPLSSANRWAVYQSAAAVATAWGATSEEALFANAFFGTSPNPISAGGMLIMGYWRSADEDVVASAGVLTGGLVDPTLTVANAQLIDDGSGVITIDGGSPVNLTGIDLRVATSMSDIAGILDTAVTGATVTAQADIGGSRLVVTSATTGASSSVTLVSEHTSGTFLGPLLGLSSGSGAEVTDGADTSTLSPEQKLDALAAIKAQVNFRGYMFIPEVEDAEVAALASWGQANQVLAYDVFSNSSHLEVSTTNPVWLVKLSSQTAYRCLFNKAGNRMMAASYMARGHVVNFEATNTAQTMNLKELTVPGESFTDAEILSARTVGLDIYKLFKRSVPKILTSSANGFQDNVYNLFAYIDAVQTDTFNTLGTVPTKIAQTDPGVQALVDSIETTTGGFVDAGVFAPGAWTRSDFFGDRDTFLANIRDRGFYIMANDLDTQPTDSRERRESPVIQTAVKNAGAIHSADIIVSFNI